MKQLCFFSIVCYMLLSVVTYAQNDVKTNSSQMPRTISYQGVLADPATGKFMPDGTYKIVVRLYGDMESDKYVYEETHGVSVVRGVFNLIIGSITPIPTTITFDRAYFLGVSVNDAEEMKPRTALSAMPYALYAENAGRAKTADVATTLSPNAPVVKGVNGTIGEINIVGKNGIEVSRNGNDILIGGSNNQSSDNISKKGNKLQGTAWIGGDVTGSIFLNFTGRDVNGNGNLNIQNNSVTMAKLNSSGLNSSNVGRVIRWNGTAWQPGTALTNFSESLITTTPNSAIPAAQLSANGTAANIDAVFSPKGTGALTAQVADNGTNGGNKRGTRATDFQTIRDNNSQVASGEQSVVVGGRANAATALNSAVLGGRNNMASNLDASVGGGAVNTASGEGSNVTGGKVNIASGNFSTIAGGRNLTLTGFGSFGFNGGNGAIGAGTDGLRQMNVSDNNTAVFGNADMWLANNDNTARALRFYEPQSTTGTFPASGTNFVALRAPNSVPNNVTWTLPSADGTSGQVLTTNGSGALAWASVSNASGTVTSVNVSGGTTGLTATGGPITSSGTLTLGGTLSIANGGTGATTANDALNGLLPTQSGNNGRVLQTNGTNTSWVAIPGLQHFTEARNTTAPNATVPVHQFSVTGAETNIDVALTPKGTGALSAQVADNATSGGNKRGTRAVDWQLERGTPTQVASGDKSVVGGGDRNTASGMNSVVGGGGSNLASGTLSVVSGGQVNNATGFSSVISGGSNNTASGQLSSILGGSYNNTGTDFATVLGGYGLTLTNTAASSIGYSAYSLGGSRQITISASSTAVFNNVDFWLTNNDNTPRTLRFYEQYNTAGAFPNGTNYVGFKAPNSVAADVTWTLPSADGTNGQVLTTNGSGELAWANAGGGLQHFTESRNTSAPNATVPVHQFSATGTETNIDVALSPKGTGALTAQVADNATSGGNKRGIYSVDWQMYRENVNQVASGTIAVIGGGAENIASGVGSVVSGGSRNTASNQGSSVGGGYSNTSNGEASVIGGGAENISSTNYSTIGGGYHNTASGYYSTVGGGYYNTASGEYSAIPGGHGLSLSGKYSFGFLGLPSGVGANEYMSLTASNTALFGNVDLWLVNNDNTPRTLRFYEQYNSAGAFPNGTNYVGFKAPNSITSDITLTLPASTPTGNGVLTSNSSGVMSWASHGRVAASAATTHVISDAAVTATSVILVTIEGSTPVSYVVSTRNAGTSFTITTSAALTTSDYINYQILP